MIVCMHCQGWPLPHTNTHSIVQDYGTGWSWGTQQVLSHWVKWMTSVWVSNVYVCVCDHIITYHHGNTGTPNILLSPSIYKCILRRERECVCVRSSGLWRGRLPWRHRQDVWENWMTCRIPVVCLPREHRETQCLHNDRDIHSRCYNTHTYIPWTVSLSQ